ncbi:MAG TPA: DegT/DnrJ/EryC1/StrS family aminotransferase [Thermodesulfovibrionales bacterium]|nr:DegT/DnrJ/EryC1/StrS family aminotransferase [Thermodesulfovibrionales bacterium]
MIEWENLAKTNKPFFDEYKARFSEILESGWFILGESVTEFEREFARYIGSKYCVGVGSGFDALVLSLKAFAFKPGSEVIVPANTYIATILAVLQNNLQPVLVEPDSETCNIDPDKIEEKITSKTVAIIVVHLYGKACDMDRIMRFAKDFDLKTIEDCAQSHGAKYKGKTTGSFGDVAAFSFYPTKNLGALGDGGAVVTDDPDFAEKIRVFRNYGSQRKHLYNLIGFNSRLDELQAGFLLIKLKNLDRINRRKRVLARLYLDNLNSEFIKPVIQDGYFDVYHIFAIRHPRRDELKEYLKNREITTEIHYPVPPHKQTALHGVLPEQAFPVSEEIHNTILSLPCAFFHTEEDVMRVIEALNEFLQERHYSK